MVFLENTIYHIFKEGESFGQNVESTSLNGCWICFLDAL